jgi:hypothetical protein
MAPKPREDYVDVAERLQLFYAKFPDGRISTAVVKFCQWPSDGIFAQAEAYRTADDPRPGVGTAWEPVPGKTPFTRDSEVQNAETAAWGRAIAACGIGTNRGISSAEEVAARQDSRSVPQPSPSPGIGDASQPTGPSGDADEAKRAHDQRSTLDVSDPDRANITALQVRRLFSIARGEYELSDATIKATIEAVTGQTSSRQIKRYQYEPVMDELARVAMAVPK